MHNVFLSLGSNVDDKEKNILNAIKLIDKIPEIRIMKGSSLYETEPVGFKKQEYFFNIILEIYTNLSPFELLQKLKDIELRLGKNIKMRWGPRSIDIDILYCGNEIIESKELTIPHPMINERRFVLVPTAEIAGNFLCPRTKLKISDIIKNCKKGEKVLKIKNWEELLSLKGK